MSQREVRRLRSGKHRNKSGMIESNSPANVAVDSVLVVFLTIVAFCSIIPLWHCLMSSVSNGQSLFSHEGLVSWPVGEFTLDGYKMALRDDSILSGYLNTIIYVLGSVAFGFVLNVLGAYVLSRRCKLKAILTFFVVFTMLFSGGVVPLYMVVRELGMTGTRWALILPHCTNAAFFIMNVKAFESVPESTVEAAQIDGAGHLRLIFQVMLPQCFSFILVTMVNTAIFAWNAWLSASIYVPTDKSRWPLQLWIRELVSTNQDFLNWTNPDYNRYLIQYCVIALATLPLIMMFPLFIKRLEKGMARGGIKG
jgi:putative aldouronate transport system permease protein